MIGILIRLASWLRKEAHTSREADSSHLSYSITYHNPEFKSAYPTTMTDLYNNGDFDLFKYQLEDKQKILILHILKNFPQEIKDQICVAIDLAIDKYLLGINFEENFYLGENEYVWNNYGN